MIIIWAVEKEAEKKVAKKPVKVTYYKEGSHFMECTKGYRFFENLEDALAWAEEDASNSHHACKEIFENGELVYKEIYDGKKFVMARV